MSDLAFRYIGIDYFDRTRALRDGVVKPEGIAFEHVPMSFQTSFRGFDEYPDADGTEMSVGNYLTLVAEGDRRSIAIPVFISRAFRFDAMYVRADGDIQKPEDLKGRKAGINDYQRTAALWQRALLMHEFGVAAGDLRWYQTRADKVASPPGVSIEVLPKGKSPAQMLLDGELDIVFAGSELPVPPEQAHRVRRLFSSSAEFEQAYYRRTGLFPIMHVVVLRRDLYEENRWIARSLVDAFTEAKKIGWQRLWRLTTPAVMLPWLQRDLQEVVEIMGPDHWPYGFAANRKTIEAMCQFHFEQGLSTRRLQPDELFAPETVE